MVTTISPPSYDPGFNCGFLRSEYSGSKSDLNVSNCLCSYGTHTLDRLVDYLTFCINCTDYLHTVQYHGKCLRMMTRWGFRWMWPWPTWRYYPKIFMERRRKIIKILAEQCLCFRYKSCSVGMNVFEHVHLHSASHTVSGYFLIDWKMLCRTWRYCETVLLDKGADWPWS